MQILSEYEWTFIRIATLLFLLIAGFFRSFYEGQVFDTYGILISTALFALWLTLSKMLTNYIDEDHSTSQSISWTYILFYYVAIPLMLLALVMLTGFFRE